MDIETNKAIKQIIIGIHGEAWVNSILNADLRVRKKMQHSKARRIFQYCVMSISIGSPDSTTSVIVPVCFFEPARNCSTRYIYPERISVTSNRM
jgi:hypothetical protein